MDLATIVTAAIVSLHPHISGEMIDVYASDISAAVEEECGHDEESCVSLALALVVVQDAESTWRESVSTCQILGDGGRAATGFQLHQHWWGGLSRREICGSNRLAAIRAARALTVLAGRTGGMRQALQRYVGCYASDPRAVRRRDTLRRLKALPEVREALAAAKAAA
jgi:hypothetical protein